MSAILLAVCFLGGGPDPGPPSALEPSELGEFSAREAASPAPLGEVAVGSCHGNVWAALAIPIMVLVAIGVGVGLAL